jgi:hypothetical protein
MNQHVYDVPSGPQSARKQESESPTSIWALADEVDIGDLGGLFDEVAKLESRQLSSSSSSAFTEICTVATTGCSLLAKPPVPSSPPPLASFGGNLYSSSLDTSEDWDETWLGDLCEVSDKQVVTRPPEIISSHLYPFVKPAKKSNSVRGILSASPRLISKSSMKIIPGVKAEKLKRRKAARPVLVHHNTVGPQPSKIRPNERKESFERENQKKRKPEEAAAFAGFEKKAQNSAKKQSVALLCGSPSKVSPKKSSPKKTGAAAAVLLSSPGDSPSSSSSSSLVTLGQVQKVLLGLASASGRLGPHPEDKQRFATLVQAAHCGKLKIVDFDVNTVGAKVGDHLNSVDRAVRDGFIVRFPTMDSVARAIEHSGRDVFASNSPIFFTFTNTASRCKDGSGCVLTNTAVVVVMMPADAKENFTRSTVKNKSKAMFPSIIRRSSIGGNPEFFDADKGFSHEVQSNTGIDKTMALNGKTIRLRTTIFKLVRAGTQAEKATAKMPLKK